MNHRDTEGTERELKGRERSRGVATIFGWLIAVSTPILFFFAMASANSPFGIRAGRPKIPGYPEGVAKYEEMTNTQKDAHSQKVREWQELIDRPFRRFHFAWIGSTVLSMIVGLGLMYSRSPIGKWPIVGTVLLIPFYLALAFFMFIAWIFRHG